MAGLIAYNWWALVPLRAGLMRSPSELFSNLEVAGHPFAAAMRAADVLAGVLLFAAFWLAGRGRPGGAAAPSWRAERAAMLAFALAGSAGAIFPQSCQDGVSASCRRLELALRLPVTEYLHMAAGVVEFGAITVALACALWRTRRTRGGPARGYRLLAAGACLAYPLLGASYLADRYGGVLEGVFFTGFTIMVLVQLTERALAGRDVPPRHPDPGQPVPQQPARPSDYYA